MRIHVASFSALLSERERERWTVNLTSSLIFLFVIFSRFFSFGDHSHPPLLIGGDAIHHMNLTQGRLWRALIRSHPNLVPQLWCWYEVVVYIIAWGSQDQVDEFNRHLQNRMMLEMRIGIMKIILGIMKIILSITHDFQSLLCRTFIQLLPWPSLCPPWVNVSLLRDPGPDPAWIYYSFHLFLINHQPPPASPFILGIHDHHPSDYCSVPFRKKGRLVHFHLPFWILSKILYDTRTTSTIDDWSKRWNRGVQKSSHNQHESTSSHPEVWEGGHLTQHHLRRW